MSKTSFTGRSRERGTPRSVRRAERTARAFIFAGGIGTILAVTMIFVFLVWVVTPLFLGADVEETANRVAVDLPARSIASGIDDYRLMSWTIDDAGSLRVFRLEDGSLMYQRPLFEGAQPTAWSFPPGTENVLMVAFADGPVRAGTINFEVEFSETADAPDELKMLAAGEVRRFGDSLVDRTRENQLRRVTLAVRFENGL